MKSPREQRAAEKLLDELEVPETYREPVKCGRPTSFTRQVAELICARLADGESLRSICRDEGMPDRSTVMGWVVRDEGGFHSHYARAREAQVEAWASELTDIADNGSNDWMQRNDPDNPGWEANGEHLQRSRLRLDTRKWLASKILKGVYGDHLKTEHSGPGGGPIQTRVVDDRPTLELLMTLAHKAIEEKRDDGIAAAEEDRVEELLRKAGG